MKTLLSGNEAIARGAYEAGVSVAAGYPGTPSTEILETIAERYKNDIYAEWSPNEKVAFEVAAGASLAGARVITTMKHVGLNVAADPLMTLSYLGVVGGFVAVVADDPGMHSSQNEQDTRHFARFAKIPILEPSDSEEAKDFVKIALEISEQFKTPVILRSTTRLSHSRSLVTEFPRAESEIPINFVKDPPRFVPIPLWARSMRVRVEERLKNLPDSPILEKVNKVIKGNDSFGVITSGVAYQYVREVFPDISVLKIGMAFPFPDQEIKKFAETVSHLLVIEELEDFLEEHIKALQIKCHGKYFVPKIGELSPDVFKNLEEKEFCSNSDYAILYKNSPFEKVFFDSTQSELEKTPLPPLPGRPPVLCPGCPHRGIFYALGRLDVIVTGDIGCYSLGVFPPLSRLDTILCMGGGVSLAHGIDKAERNRQTPQKIVGMVGDSTFFHSGITGLLDIAYNKGRSTIIVVDNRITAMTGHQDNPGSGKTLMGESTAEASIEEIGRACGIKNVRTIDPRDIKTAVTTLKEATDSSEPWLIVSKAPCPLHLRKALGPPLSVTESVCKKCNACLKLGCPGLEKDGNRIRINELLCAGCEMCKKVCLAKAIV